MAALAYGRHLDACAGVGASREGAARQERSSLPIVALGAAGWGNAAAADPYGDSAEVRAWTVRQCAT